MVSRWSSKGKYTTSHVAQNNRQAGLQRFTHRNESLIVCGIEHLRLQYLLFVNQGK